MRVAMMFLLFSSSVVWSRGGSVVVVEDVFPGENRSSLDLHYENDGGFYLDMLWTKKNGSAEGRCVVGTFLFHDKGMYEKTEYAGVATLSGDCYVCTSEKHRFAYSKGMNACSDAESKGKPSNSATTPGVLNETYKINHSEVILPAGGNTAKNLF